jgi:hypothetical protein
VWLAAGPLSPTFYELEPNRVFGLLGWHEVKAVRHLFQQALCRSRRQIKRAIDIRKLQKPAAVDEVLRAVVELSMLTIGIIIRREQICVY